MYSHIAGHAQSAAQLVPIHKPLVGGYRPQAPIQKQREVEPMARQRSKQLNIRISEDEAAKLQTLIQKSTLTQSEYLRKSILNKKITVVQELPEFTTEIKRIGNNLNQITRAVHAEQIYDCRQEIKQLQEEMKQIWQSLNAYLQKVQ